MKVFRIAAIVAAVSLAACNGIGDGNKLETLSVVPVAQATTSANTVASTKIFRCVRDQLRAFGKFSNGEIGEYTPRGRWSSSNPEIVKVSNGDLVLDAVPGQPTGVVFAAGTLTPIAPGTATVSFDFVGLHQQIEVTVEDLDNSAITITPADSSMAPGSSQFLKAIADLDGTTADITSTATWTFVEENEEVATIDPDDGFVAAIAPGGTLTAKATLTACDAAPTATITVKPIQTLTLTKAFADDRLVSNTSEKLTVIADFGDGTTQDLSLQATYCLAPPTQTSIAFLASSGLRDHVLAQSPGSAGLLAAFPPFSSIDRPDTEDPFTCAEPPPADQFLQSNDLTLTAVAAALCSIDVTAATPADPKNATIEFGETQQFNATGTFTTATIDATHPAAQACADTASLLTQDITRHVVWTVSDATIAAIVNPSQAFLLSGLSSGIKAEGGTVTITATTSSTGLAVVNQVTGANTATLTITPKP
jgi:hypothetical protein